MMRGVNFLVHYSYFFSFGMHSCCAHKLVKYQATSRANALLLATSSEDEAQILNPN